jgi:hypothetical protein
VKAVFNPTDPTALATSESAVVTYVVNPVPATPTTTMLAATPSSPQTFGTTLILTGTVVPTSAVGATRCDGDVERASIPPSGRRSGSRATAYPDRACPAARGCG